MQLQKTIPKRPAEIAQIFSPMQREITFRVQVSTDEDVHVYEDIFQSACDAITDAMERFADAQTIHVKKVAP